MKTILGTLVLLALCTPLKTTHAQDANAIADSLYLIALDEFRLEDTPREPRAKQAIATIDGVEYMLVLVAVESTGPETNDRLQVLADKTADNAGYPTLVALIGSSRGGFSMKADGAGDWTNSYYVLKRK